MKRQLSLLSLLAVLLVATLACGESTSTTAPTPSTGNYSLPPLPESRSFRLGLQPFPHALTAEAIEQAHEYASQHADLLFYHFDRGVPWPEALAGGPYPQNFLDEILPMAEKRRNYGKLYLAITPNQPERDQLALYWGEESDGLPLPPDWENKSFDEPEVLIAYLNFARFMIDTFQPDYFAYGIEVTCSTSDPDAPEFAAYLSLARQVYTTLKAEYPDLSIFHTICTGSFDTDSLDVLMETGRRALEFSDYVAISTYPYWIVPGMKIRQANPADLPRDWFVQWAALAPEKPFAISETGYIAEDMVIPDYDVHIQGNPVWQADYVAFMLQSLNDLKAEFVAWFVPRDYDRLYEQLQSMGLASPAWLIWRDNGLWDGNGKARPALDVWGAWLALPLEPER